MPIKVRNLAQLQTDNPKLYETLSDVVAGLNNATAQTNSDGSGVTPPPPPITSLTVVGGDGYFDLKIDDVAQFRGLEYFAEYSLDPSFSAPYVIHIGAPRNWRGPLGNLTLYWRAHSQYDTSSPSAYVYFGSQSAPAPVVGGGSATGPAPLPSGGSGTGGGGYGVVAYTPVNGKKPIRQ